MKAKHVGQFFLLLYEFHNPAGEGSNETQHLQNRPTRTTQIITLFMNYP